jgi:FMN phosphatase YigB (HAD superfamily)
MATPRNELELRLDSTGELRTTYPQALVFDLGNVFLQADRSITQQYLVGLGANGERAAKFYEIPEYADFSRGIISAQAFYEAVRKTTGLSSLEYKQAKEAHAKHITGLVPGMKDLLGRIAEHYSGRIVFATDTNVWQTERQRELIDLSGYRVFASNGIGMLKGDPELDEEGPRRSFFRSVLEELGIEASNILFIDDSLEKVGSARSLGMQIFPFTNHEELALELEARQIIG